MNLFILEKTAVDCAISHHDSHLRKMPLETAQLLNTGLRPDDRFFEVSHFNHPCARWLRENKSNFKFGLDLLYALCGEYNYRFGKSYFAMEVYADLISRSVWPMPDGEMTEPALAMPLMCQIGNAIESYRFYYKHFKDFSTYTKRSRPTWLSKA